MAKSVIKKMLPPAGYPADLMFQFTNGYLGYDAAEWDDALPSGNKGKMVSLSTTYTQSFYDKPDFVMDTTLKLAGDFRKVGGEWTGKVTKAVFQMDGDTVAVIKINSGVDLSRLTDKSYSSLIWNELTQTGLRGQLSTGSERQFFGSVSDDNLNGRAGHDYINGGLGNDRLVGGAGNDRLNGHTGDDTLIGGAGDDVLDGRGGSDRAFGGSGNDLFRADGDGVNVWTGGKGADRFQTGSALPYGTLGVSVTVTDFNRKQGDVLDLTEDSTFLFYDPTGIRYIGKKQFSGEAGVYEIRMENGTVAIDQNGDGIADVGLHLEGHGTFGIRDTS